MENQLLQVESTIAFLCFEFEINVFLNILFKRYFDFVLCHDLSFGLLLTLFHLLEGLVSDKLPVVGPM